MQAKTIDELWKDIENKNIHGCYDGKDIYSLEMPAVRARDFDSVVLKNFSSATTEYVLCDFIDCLFINVHFGYCTFDECTFRNAVFLNCDLKDVTTFNMCNGMPKII